MERSDSPVACATRRLLLLGGLTALAGCNDVGGTLPHVVLPRIEGLLTPTGFPVPGIDTSRFAGRVTVLNVWASWCPYCRGEHELLKSLPGSGPFTLAGLVHQDTADPVRSYLKQAGNPFAELAIDENSTLFRALRQRGVPHTYVIGRDLTVVAKVPGELSEQAIRAIIRPAVEKARSASV